MIRGGNQSTRHLALAEEWKGHNKYQHTIINKQALELRMNRGQDNTVSYQHAQTPSDAELRGSTG